MATTFNFPEYTPLFLNSEHPAMDDIFLTDLYHEFDELAPLEIDIGEVPIAEYSSKCVLGLTSDAAISDSDSESDSQETPLKPDSNAATPKASSLPPVATVPSKSLSQAEQAEINRKQQALKAQQWKAAEAMCKRAIAKVQAMQTHRSNVAKYIKEKRKQREEELKQILVEKCRKRRYIISVRIMQASNAKKSLASLPNPLPTLKSFTPATMPDQSCKSTVTSTESNTQEAHVQEESVAIPATSSPNRKRLRPTNENILPEERHSKRQKLQHDTSSTLQGHKRALEVDGDELDPEHSSSIPKRQKLHHDISPTLLGPKRPHEAEEDSSKTPKSQQYITFSLLGQKRHRQTVEHDLSSEYSRKIPKLKDTSKEDVREGVLESSVPKGDVASSPQADPSIAVSTIKESKETVVPPSPSKTSEEGSKLPEPSETNTSPLVIEELNESTAPPTKELKHAVVATGPQKITKEASKLSAPSEANTHTSLRTIEELKESTATPLKEFKDAAIPATTSKITEEHPQLSISSTADSSTSSPNIEMPKESTAPPIREFKDATPASPPKTTEEDLRLSTSSTVDSSISPSAIDKSEETIPTKAEESKETAVSTDRKTETGKGSESVTKSKETVVLVSNPMIADEDPKPSISKSCALIVEKPKENVVPTVDESRETAVFTPSVKAAGTEIEPLKSSEETVVPESNQRTAEEGPKLPTQSNPAPGTSVPITDMPKETTGTTAEESRETASPKSTPKRVEKESEASTILGADANAAITIICHSTGVQTLPIGDAATFKRCYGRSPNILRNNEIGAGGRGRYTRENCNKDPYELRYGKAFLASSSSTPIKSTSSAFQTKDFTEVDPALALTRAKAHIVANKLRKPAGAQGVVVSVKKDGLLSHSSAIKTSVKVLGDGTVEYDGDVDLSLLFPNLAFEAEPHDHKIPVVDFLPYPPCTFFAERGNAASPAQEAAFADDAGGWEVKMAKVMTEQEGQEEKKRRRKATSPPTTIAAPEKRKPSTGPSAPKIPQSESTLTVTAPLGGARFTAANPRFPRRDQRAAAAPALEEEKMEEKKESAAAATVTPAAASKSSRTSTRSRTRGVYVPPGRR